jgi:hypothetical protein
MTRADIRTVLDGVPEFVASAVEQLALSLGQNDPTVLAGRRILASLAAIPDDAVLVTEQTLAAAIQRAWPYRQRTPSGLNLSAASILAALRVDS